MYILVCPYCGHELLKAENESYIEITCPNCNVDIAVEIKDDTLTITKKTSE